jgi:hypothetical protein
MPRYQTSNRDIFMALMSMELSCTSPAGNDFGFAHWEAQLLCAVSVLLLWSTLKHTGGERLESRLPLASWDDSLIGACKKSGVSLVRG